MNNKIEYKKNNQHLNTVKNALKILKSFSERRTVTTVKELSERLDISTSAVSRLMSTLASEGFVTKIPGTHQFRLGTSVLLLSGILTASLEVHEEAIPIMQKLVKLTGETSHLTILENFHTVYLHKIDNQNPVRTLSHLGKSNPLHCTSSGKILTAFMDEPFIKTIVSRGLEKYSPNTITDPDIFIDHLKQVRAQEYAYDIEEFIPGLVSIAAPIRDYTNQVIAAVNIVGPIQRVNQSTMPKLINQVIKAAKEISNQMGYIKQR